MPVIKGKRGRFIDRAPTICAAGVKSAQSEGTMAELLQHHLLQDEVDALISDAIIPPPPLRHPLPLRHPPLPDTRHAGVNCEIADILNPPKKTKWETLANDIKETSYNSYWNKSVGRTRDPKGMDLEQITFGMKYVHDDASPILPLADVEPHRRAAYQSTRNYCKPFKPDATFGIRSHVDKRGILVKCCMTDDSVVQGTADHVVMQASEANFRERNQSHLGYAGTPNNNINEVPMGHKVIKVDTGSVVECLRQCELNPERELLMSSLEYLYSIRNILAARQLLPPFYRTLYLNFIYYDTEKSGWLPKDLVYNHCRTKCRIRFSFHLLEPLLIIWSAFDGERVDYKIFVNLLNAKEPILELPKIPDMKPECLEYRTTYGEMTKLGKMYEGGKPIEAPSGRFDREFAPLAKGYFSGLMECHEESDVKSCLNPSVMTQMNVSNRDMYEKREPETIRRVFEAATGEQFTDERFNAILEKAKMSHPQGFVCYNTFRRALQEDYQSETEQF